MAKRLPCLEKGCSACCRETTMPITKTEAALLSRRTGMKLEQFTWDNKGVLTLLNDENTKACVFLMTDSSEKFAEGICSVYDIRPKGCTLYPIVLNNQDLAIIDDGCPYGDDFPKPTSEDNISLLNLEERLLQGQ